MVELPLLRIADVRGLHHLLDEPARQVAIAWYLVLVDAEPTWIFDRAVVAVGHAECERRHVVHEEVGEVLGGDHDDGVGFRRFEVDAHLIERDVEAIANVGISLVGSTSDSRRV